ncbi:MAG TPA: sugar phosphate isomerase/epimerase [Firmicutes bacterium]|jgi:sugar phosphate isomerase/epimerase|nr:sugar phosphate isomerase/epimerase [Bacillota bacterium]
MKIGVFAVLYGGLSLRDMLKKVKSYGLSTVEIGCGGYPGKAHCDPVELLANPAKLAEFKQAFEDEGVQISALSVHGNALHPNKEIAKGFHEDWRNAVRLAEKLGIEIINTFSGCPGDSDDSKYPNWVTCAWPNDFADILEWQWNEKVIPYWTEEAKFAADHGVNKIAFEMHPGFVIYNVDTLFRLRKAVGPSIGTNFDPSHLIWQGADPVAAIRALGKEQAIFHVHAKDTHIDPYNTAVNGVLDTKPYDRLPERSWLFRSVGYGNDYKYWKDMVSELRIAGYDYVLSIEHEDALASIDEGFGKAVTFLKEVILDEPMPQAWWI